MSSYATKDIHDIVAIGAKISVMALIAFGRHKRWAYTTVAERHEVGRRLRRQKGAKHAHVTQFAIGHHAFMRLCWRYQRQFGRKLTPAERAHIRVVHAEEIAKTAVGWPWVKKPRVSYPELPDPPEM